MKSIKVIKNLSDISKTQTTENVIFEMDVEKLLDNLPEEPMFDLVITSPPYNIGKEYEKNYLWMNILNGKEELLKKYIVD